MSEHIGQALILCLVLVLPLAALVGRKLPWSTTIRYALAWAGVFLLLYAIVALFT